MAKVTYLLNSGFVVEIDQYILIFDYYQDPTHYVDSIITADKKVYFFSSHVHFDHYTKEIIKYQNSNVHYILSYDIRKDLPPADLVAKMNEYDTYQHGDLHVQSFSSTDAGISFYVEIAGWRIFHAGDFNWWHWSGDTPENIAFARNGFVKQMNKLPELECDIAFFPVDARLEEARDWGVKAFCAKEKVHTLITMHNVGGTPWKVPADFPKVDQILSPSIPGTSFEINK